MITQDSLNYRVLRSPYKAGEEKGPPPYGSESLKHYGVDHRKVCTAVPCVYLHLTCFGHVQRFPYQLNQACDEPPPEQTPSGVVTAFNPLPFDLVE